MLVPRTSSLTRTCRSSLQSPTQALCAGDAVGVPMTITPVGVAVSPTGVDVAVLVTEAVAVGVSTTITGGVGESVATTGGVAVGVNAVGTPGLQSEKPSMTSHRLCAVQTSKSSQAAPRFAGSHRPVLGLHCWHTGMHRGALTEHSPVSGSHASVHGLPSVSGHTLDRRPQDTKFPARTRQRSSVHGTPILDEQG